eukprot:CAMPEP_0114566556 /NCGR_PEP_ID=MMETSP0114-20121206/14959_1 /TAXON_ID=31324 /ORGANISM="Goniomonas sp, Strain m" /LENGTH=56 /DNA_ID=CAMNT_0001752983 /DNA_START=16 /DNA_END=186 /DNA_ORIENTATION=+
MFALASQLSQLFETEQLNMKGGPYYTQKHTFLAEAHDYGIGDAEGNAYYAQKHASA